MATMQVRLKLDDAQLIVDVLAAAVENGNDDYGPEEIAPVQARMWYLLHRARARAAIPGAG